MRRAVEAAVQAEQTVQEDRNRRALDLLQAKDAALKVAETKVRQQRPWQQPPCAAHSKKGSLAAVSWS